MICTEAEAGTKVCKRDMFCTKVEVCNGAESRFYDENALFCIASACMMWEWDAWKSEIINGKSVVVPKKEKGGYCGLSRTS
jgi:hypothetical protein